MIELPIELPVWLALHALLVVLGIPQLPQLAPEGRP